MYRSCKTGWVCFTIKMYNQRATETYNNAMSVYLKKDWHDFRAYLYNNILYTADNSEGEVLLMMQWLF